MYISYIHIDHTIQSTHFKLSVFTIIDDFHNFMEKKMTNDKEKNDKEKNDSLLEGIFFLPK
jgi:hypothetical protein